MVATAAHGDGTKVRGSVKPKLDGDRLKGSKKGVSKWTGNQNDKNGNGKHPKIVSHKNRIRSLQRLLSRAGLPDNVRKRTEKQLEEAKQAAATQQRALREQKLAKRYHKVRFFERVKLERRLKVLDTQVSRLRDKEKNVPLDMLQVLEQLQDDLQYVKYFPKGERYVSLLRNAEDAAGQARLDAERERLRALVRRKVADLAMVTQPDEGAGLTRPQASAMAPPAMAKDTQEADDFFLEADDESEGKEGEPLPAQPQNAEKISSLAAPQRLDEGARLQGQSEATAAHHKRGQAAPRHALMDADGAADDGKDSSSAEDEASDGPSGAAPGGGGARVPRAGKGSTVKDAQGPALLPESSGPCLRVTGSKRKQPPWRVLLASEERGHDEEVKGEELQNALKRVLVPENRKASKQVQRCRSQFDQGSNPGLALEAATTALLPQAHTRQQQPTPAVQKGDFRSGLPARSPSESDDGRDDEQASRDSIRDDREISQDQGGPVSDEEMEDEDSSSQEEGFEHNLRHPVYANAGGGAHDDNEGTGSEDDSDAGTGSEDDSDAGMASEDDSNEGTGSEDDGEGDTGSEHDSGYEDGLRGKDGRMWGPAKLSHVATVDLMDDSNDSQGGEQAEDEDTDDGGVGGRVGDSPDGAESSDADMVVRRAGLTTGQMRKGGGWRVAKEQSRPGRQGDCPPPGPGELVSVGNRGRNPLRSGPGSRSRVAEGASVATLGNGKFPRNLEGRPRDGSPLKSAGPTVRGGLGGPLALETEPHMAGALPEPVQPVKEFPVGQGPISRLLGLVANRGRSTPPEWHLAGGEQKKPRRAPDGPAEVSIPAPSGQAPNSGKESREGRGPTHFPSGTFKSPNRETTAEPPARSGGTSLGVPRAHWEGAFAPQPHGAMRIAREPAREERKSKVLQRSTVKGPIRGEGGTAKRPFKGEGCMARGPFKGEGGTARRPFKGEGGTARGPFKREGRTARGPFKGEGGKARVPFKGEGGTVMGPFKGDGRIRPAQDRQEQRPPPKDEAKGRLKAGPGVLRAKGKKEKKMPLRTRAEGGRKRRSKNRRKEA
eukprot:jgi/Botrbrau1/21328/Bobra.0184s0038.1